MDTISDLVFHGRPIRGCGLGWAVTHGDINGDGYDDMVISGYAEESVGGRVFIYFGGPEFDTIPDWVLTGHQYAEDFGISLGSRVDLNMDGFDDIIVGAWLYGPGYPGRVYIYFGGDPMDGTADAWLTGEGPNQHLGLFNVDLIKNTGGYGHAIAGTPFWSYGFFSPLKLLVS